MTHNDLATNLAAALAALTSSQRAIVEHILRTTPNYRYDLTPQIYPTPVPGLPSALAAVKTMVARIKAKLIQLERGRDAAAPEPAYGRLVDGSHRDDRIVH